MSRSEQSITVVLPNELVRAARGLAEEQGIDFSQLVADALTDALERRRQYDRSRCAELDVMQRRIDLGLRGRIGWTRDELHDR